MDKIDGNQLRGHLEGMALAVLEQGDAHGYEILQRLTALGEGALQLKEGSLYPVLYRLEESGRIKGHWEKDDAPRRGPRRRIYSLTKKGRKALDESRVSWRSFTTIVGRIMEAES